MQSKHDVIYVVDDVLTLMTQCQIFKILTMFKLVIVLAVETSSNTNKCYTKSVMQLVNLPIISTKLVQISCAATRHFKHYLIGPPHEKLDFCLC